MVKWLDINDKKPRYTGLYLVYCTIGNMLGGYKEVRAYIYSVQGWCLPSYSDEVITITHWAELPEPPVN